MGWMVRGGEMRLGGAPLAPRTEKIVSTSSFPILSLQARSPSVCILARAGFDATPSGSVRDLAEICPGSGRDLAEIYPRSARAVM